MSAEPGGEPIRADAIVVAAGSSVRMNGRDKMEALVAGRPLLAWTLDALAASPAVERIVVVVPPARTTELEGQPWLPPKVVAVTEGGGRRQDSVAAGLRCLDRLAAIDGRGDSPDRVVLVHDGARPLATPDLATHVAEGAAEHGAAIPVVPVAETLKRVKGDQVAETVDRTGLAAAQTPQGFRRGVLRTAYERFPPDGPDTWTDEAALLEACRIPVHALPGEPANLKVTLPGDLARVEASLMGRAVPRIGLGMDSHSFGPDDGLSLGGLTIARAPRLHGHSDGDVALHAVADALLGAAGLGDLGRLFPSTAETPRGISSRELLTDVLGRLTVEGFRPVSVDLTIVAARPRLALLLDEMALAIAEILDLDPLRVSVKASTGNLAGMEGAGRGVSAHAVAQIAQLVPLTQPRQRAIGAEPEPAEHV